MTINQPPPLLPAIASTVLKMGGVAIGLGYVYPHLATALAAFRLF